MKSDIEVAREYKLSPVAEIAAKLAIPETALQLQGRTIAKIDADFLATLKGRPEGKLILVTAINPTPAGEGKTTTTIGLGDGLTRIGVRTAICLREPSLGPCFGQKGGATGGGRAQVAPMDEINLHFTGDFHAITSAHNLLAAMIDNHIHWGNALEIDACRVVWRRALDMNDRALREIVRRHGRPRQRLRPRGRLRNHRRLGGDGDVLPERDDRGNGRAARPDDRRLHAGKETGHREGHQRQAYCTPRSE